MSKKLIGWSLRQAPVMYPDLSSGALHLLAMLCEFYNDETRKAYPAIETLAKLMHTSKQSVRNYMKELEAVGVVEKIMRTGQSNIYKVKAVTPIETYTRGLQIIDLDSQKSKRSKVKNLDPNPYEPLDNIPPFELEDEPVPYWQLEHEPLTEQTQSVIEELKAKLL